VGAGRLTGFHLVVSVAKTTCVMRHHGTVARGDASE
jgi:hypothetical protein